ncbi:MAG: hypothetical protein RL660_1084 [Bacteroidota bacterium]|jgi:PKD repeat protein
MFKQCLLAVFSLLAICTTQVSARTYKVLFIGNSYCAVNDLPGMLRDMSNSMGDSMQVTSVTPGGYTLNGHWTNTASLAAIATPGWDFVIIQAQSQEPSFSPGQVAANTMPYAKSLDSFVKASNSCAEVLYYMTWGRKYGDPVNCPNYSVLCTYDGMQTRLRDSYVQMANDNNSSVCPAGQVWRSIRQQDSTIELYQSDLSHPSVTGTYVVACAFYTSIYHKALSASSFVPSGVTAANATLIRNTAYAIVMDSIETWQGSGSIPLAKFSATPTGLTANITNSSKRNNSCDWYWGDATSTTNAPQAALNHNYVTAGTYTINMVASSACKYDSAKAVVEVVVPNGITNVKDATAPIISAGTNQIICNLQQASDIVEVVNANGQIVFTSKQVSAGTTLSIPCVSGLYIVRSLQSGRLLQNKVVVP